MLNSILFTCICALSCSCYKIVIRTLLPVEQSHTHNFFLMADSFAISSRCVPSRPLLQILEDSLLRKAEQIPQLTGKIQNPFALENGVYPWMSLYVVRFVVTFSYVAMCSLC